MRNIIRSILVLAAAVAAPATAAADVPRVGIVVATRVNVTDGEGDGLSVQLADALRSDLQVDIIAGAEARRRLPPGGLPEDCVARRKCVRDVAERLDADQLLFLVMVRLGSRLQIDSTWVGGDGAGAASRPAIVIEDGGAPAVVVFAETTLRLLPNAAPRAAAVPAPAAVTAVEVRTAPRGRHVTRPVIVAGAIAGLALVGGVGFALSARSDYDALEEAGCDRVTCPEAEERVDRMENKALAADILFGAAAAAAVTSGILYLVSAEDLERAPVTVGATDGGGTVSFRARF